MSDLPAPDGATADRTGVGVFLACSGRIASGAALVRSASTLIAAELPDYSHLFRWQGLIIRSLVQLLYPAIRAVTPACTATRPIGATEAGLRRRGIRVRRTGCGVAIVRVVAATLHFVVAFTAVFVVALPLTVTRLSEGARIAGEQGRADDHAERAPSGPIGDKRATQSVKLPTIHCRVPRDARLAEVARTP
jgi:hypothetical protein